MTSYYYHSRSLCHAIRRAQTSRMITYYTLYLWDQKLFQIPPDLPRNTGHVSGNSPEQLGQPYLQTQARLSLNIDLQYYNFHIRSNYYYFRSPPSTPYAPLPHAYSTPNTPDILD